MNTAPPTVCYPKRIAYHLLQGKAFYYFFSGLLGFLLYAATPNAAQAIIVTTLPPLSGLVSMLDAKAEVYCLLPPGADVHNFQITPKQVQQIKHADLLLRASRDDGHWPGLNMAVQRLDLWPKKDHAWLLPSEVRRILPLLAGRLQDIAPAHRQSIAQSLKRALRVCDELEMAWKQALTPFQQRGVIMQHPAWRRLCEHFNVPVRAVLEPRHHGSVRPRQLEHALNLVRAHTGILLWGNVHHSNRGLTWLSEHSDNRPVLRFDALGPCNMAWDQLIRWNLKRLKQMTL